MLSPRTAILLLILSAAILAIWWPDRSQEEQSPRNADSSAPAPAESWSRELRTTQYNTEGRIDYILEADGQTQENTARARIESPRLRLFEDNQVRWALQSATGLLTDPVAGQRRELELIDAVELVHTPGSGQEIVLQTSHMRVYPDTEVLYSDVPVRLTGTGFRQTSAGLRAALQEDEMIFPGRVEGRIDGQ